MTFTSAWDKLGLLPIYRGSFNFLFFWGGGGLLRGLLWAFILLGNPKDAFVFPLEL